MEPRERIFLIQLSEKIKKDQTYAKKLGLTDESRYVSQKTNNKRG